MKKRLICLIGILLLASPAGLYANSFGASVKSKTLVVAKGTSDFTQYLLGLPFTLAQRALQKIDILG